MKKIDMFLNKTFKWNTKDLIKAITGAFIYALAINLFIVPNSLYNGGILGISQLIRTLITEAFSLNLSFDIAGIINFLFNIPLLFIAYKMISKTFFGRTVICVCFTTLFLTVIPIPEKALINDLLTNVLIGGILAGLGSGKLLSSHGSGGGTDIIGIALSMANRLADAEEMAKPLLFLNSDMASFISGTCLKVDYCNDAMIRLGLKKDLLDVKVGSKLYNLGFMQKMLKKQLASLDNNNETNEDKHFIAVTNDEKLSDDDFRNKVNSFNEEVNENKVAPEEEIDEAITPDMSDLKLVEDINEEEEKEVITHNHKVTDEEKEEIHEEITKSFLDSEEDVETL